MFDCLEQASRVFDPDAIRREREERQSHTRALKERLGRMRVNQKR